MLETQHRTVVHLSPHVPNFVTPYLAAAAKHTVNNWQRQTKMPALVLAFDQAPTGCRNCSGIGKMFIRLCNAGPFQAPPHGVITWYEGNGQFGKGWYVVEDTIILECPECNGGVK